MLSAAKHLDGLSMTNRRGISATSKGLPAGGEIFEASILFEEG